jgi:hypothetical protein
MRLENMSLDAIRQKAKALKELNITEVYVDNDAFPWRDAYACEPGGTYRLGIYVSAWFKAKDSVSGLEFRTIFDIEKSGASGSPNYEIDVDKCLDLIPRLNITCAGKFMAFLRESAEKVEKQGKEYFEAAREQLSVAAMLREAANG